jgi:Domain of unknown function (DUF4314)
LSKTANAETVIVDFLADLHRLVDVLDADFEQLSERGRRRYAGPAADHPNPSRRRDLQPGTRFRLINCADRRAYVQPGTRGTVSFVDDAGTAHINWNGGGTLGLRSDADRYEIISQTRPATARDSHRG